MQKENIAHQNAHIRRFQEEVGAISIKKFEYIGKQDVYNLEVKRHHNFLVNGGAFIVHNCQDGTRYAIMGVWKYIRKLLPFIDIEEGGDE